MATETGFLLYPEGGGEGGTPIQGSACLMILSEGVGAYLGESLGSYLR